MKTSFVERTAAFWNWFDENEKRLSDMVKNKKIYDIDEVVAAYPEGTKIINEDSRCFDNFVGCGATAVFLFYS